MFDIQLEANFIKSVENYIDKHGADMIYALIKPKTKKSIVPKVVELEPVVADVEKYKKEIKKISAKYHKVVDNFLFYDGVGRADYYMTKIPIHIIKI